MAASLEQDLIFTVGGLQPGLEAEASFAYTPDDGTGGRNTGVSAQKVRANGVVRFQVDYEEVVSDKHRPGVLRAWARAKGSGFSGPALETSDGEAEVEVTIT